MRCVPFFGYQQKAIPVITRFADAVRSLPLIVVISLLAVKVSRYCSLAVRICA
ncbi:hypothetical protein EDWATA_03332 [Edwardsiella tarda ATCC 23685]|uniref:Uncharacterized protein n=1 Tax=Edwardsiella tarda ATCC 23685 TaxID=500638 RepID=D4F976_EDWTA|nr:hypothetical protein EDWATA_03332 [Edwardsiella tarda ATCC 23685]